LQYLHDEIGNLYPEQEYRGIRRIVFDKLADIHPVDFHLSPNLEIPIDKFEEIKKVTTELKIYKPIQYILGTTDFLGLKLKVSPAVLIPRPETEEMADWIIKTHKYNENKILDIGAGSGCLAIALNKLMFHSKTDSIDISQEALEIAKENSQLNESIVNFFKYDILQGYNSSGSEYFEEFYDIIVSNPPYISHNEIAKMPKNVIDYEPHLALFVDDSDPLIFYKSISDFARMKLEWSGFLYLEINPRFHKEIHEMLMLKGYRNIQLRNDKKGMPRMIRAQIKLSKKGQNPELEKFRTL
jgi:release factor glutamine methyltransferase